MARCIDERNESLSLVAVETPSAEATAVSPPRRAEAPHADNVTSAGAKTQWIIAVVCMSCLLDEACARTSYVDPCEEERRPGSTRPTRSLPTGFADDPLRQRRAARRVATKHESGSWKSATRSVST